MNRRTCTALIVVLLFSDRDAGFYQPVYNDGEAHWWDAERVRLVR